MAFLWRFLGDLFHVNDSVPTPAAIARKRRPAKATSAPANPPTQPPSLGYNDFVNAIVDSAAINVGSSSGLSRDFHDPVDAFTLRSQHRLHTSATQDQPWSYAAPPPRTSSQHSFKTHLAPHMAVPPPSSRSGGGGLPRLRERSNEAPPTSTTKAPTPRTPSTVKPPPVSIHRRSSKWLFEYQDNSSTNLDSFVAPPPSSTGIFARAPTSNRTPPAKVVSTAAASPSQANGLLSTREKSRVPPQSLASVDPPSVQQQRRRSPQRTRNQALNIAKEMSGRYSGDGGRSSTSSLLSPLAASSGCMTPKASESRSRRPVARRLSSSEYLARHASSDFMTVHRPDCVMPDQANVLPPPPPSSWDVSSDILSQFQEIRSRSDPAAAGLQRRPSMDLTTRLHEAAQRIPQETLLPTCRKLKRSNTPKTTKRVRFTD